jgi:thiol-disulfide isomerase/thioredoxin
LLCGIAAVASAADLRATDGQIAPPLRLPGVDGSTQSLADHRGKVLVVTFWATWCEPCRDEMPSLDRLRRRFAGKGLEVLAVNFKEGEPRIREFLEQVPVSFPVLLDRDGAAARQWKVSVLPVTFVTDRDHRVRYVALGEIRWDRPDVVDAVHRLLSPG